MLGIGERGGGVAIAELELGAEIVPALGMAQPRAGGQRVAAVRRGGQDFVVDFDRGGGVLGLVAGLGEHHGDRLANETDFLVLQQTLLERLGDRRVGHLERRPDVAQPGRQIGRGDDFEDPRHGFRRGGVDTPDAGMRLGRADERRLQHARQLDVVGEHRAPGQKRRVLHPFDPGAHRLGTHGLRPRPPP